MNDLLTRFALIEHETKHTQQNIGKTFSSLTVLAIGKPVSSYRYTAICQCECGRGPFTVRMDKLTSGHTRSCGCLQIESASKHGLYKHRLYHVWKGMMSRCYKKNDTRYSSYGARGIIVCKRWHYIANFISDMDPSYRKGLQLDRRNNDADYSPANCRWATISEQQRNKRSNINITIDGTTKTLAEWCSDFGIRYQLAWERIKVQRWSAEKALRTPAR